MSYVIAGYLISFMSIVIYSAFVIRRTKRLLQVAQSRTKLKP